MTPVSKLPNFKENFHFPTAPNSDPTNVTGKDTDHDVTNDHEDDIESDKHLPEESHERTINLKRWIPLPQVVADRKPEPKYLADRRPGLPPLYGHRAATSTNTANTTGYAPNISSTFLPSFNPNVNTGDVVVGTVTVPIDRVANASGYRVKADGTTVPMGPGIAAGSAMGMSGAAGQVQGEVKRRPPPPPPKRRKKGGPGRSKRKVEVPEPVAEGEKKGDDSVALQGIGTQIGAGPGGEQATVGAHTTVPAERQSRIQSQAPAQLGDPGTAKVGVDIEMGEAENDGEESSSSSISSEDEGSEEGEIDEGGGPSAITTAAVATDTSSTIYTATNATPPAEPALQALQAPIPPLPALATTPTTTTSTPDAQAATSTTPPVQERQTTPSTPAATVTPSAIPPMTSASASASIPIQPPSPDLLGNLESEIQGMEEGGREGTEEK